MNAHKEQVFLHLLWQPVVELDYYLYDRNRVRLCAANIQLHGDCACTHICPNCLRTNTNINYSDQ